jgi:hypothetical protein
MNFMHSFLIGDWSGDGHNASESIIFRANRDRPDIVKAYMQAVEKGKIALHYGDVSDDTLVMLEEYDRDFIDADEIECLKMLGISCEWVEAYGKFDPEDEDSVLYFSPQDTFRLFMEMVKSQLPDFRWEVLPTPTPINNSKEFSASIGYGLYL